MLPLLFVAATAVPPIVIDAPVPGGDPQAVADTVAAPLELQLRGASGVRHVRSLSTDGRCLVRLDLDPTADRARARAAVADRLAGRPGIRLRPDADDAVVVVAVRSGGKADATALAAATHQVRPRLAALPRVADVVVVGAAEDGLRVAVDPDRLAALNLTVGDVLAALRPAVAAARPAAADDLGNLVITAARGQPVRVRDVAAVEREVRQAGGAGSGWHPGVLLLIRPAPGAAVAVSGAVQNLLAGPGWNVPPTVSFESHAFDTGTIVTLRLPGGSRPEHLNRLALDTARAATRVAGVWSVAWIPGPGDDAVSLLVTGRRQDLGAADLAPAGVAARVGRMRWPLDDWPGEGAAIVARVSGDNVDAVTAAAGELRERLASIAGVADLAAEPGDRVRPAVRIDRAKAAKLGVTVDTINETVALATTGVRLGSVVVSVPRGADDLRAVRIPNGEGQLVPLGTVIEVRREHGPVAVYREGGRPCRVVACGVRGRDVAAVRADVQGITRQLTTAGITIGVE